MSTNYLAFSISKATPTTSTNNENTISGKATPVTNATSSAANNGGTITPPSALLNKSADISSASSPNFGPLNPIPVSSISPTLVTSAVSEDVRTVKPDLIGLFDKFDINKSDTKFDDLLEREVGDEDKQEFSEKQGGEDGDSDEKQIGDSSQGQELKQLEDVEVGTEEKVEEDDEELERQRRIEAALGNLTEEQEMEETEVTGSSSLGHDTTIPPSSPSAPALTSVDNQTKTKNILKETLNTGDVRVESESNLNRSDHEVSESVTQSSNTVGNAASSSTSGEGWTKVNPVEQHQQSHKPFDFQTFLVHLKKKSADPIVRYIRSFLVSFSRQAHTFSSQQKIKIITDFKIFINEKFTLYEPFASMDDIDLENSREGLEKLIMNRLYDYCFPPAISKLNNSYIDPMITSDLNEDSIFIQQVEKFSWINGGHLDISIEDLQQNPHKSDKVVNFLDYGVAELNKINNYRAPRDKIICVLNLCKVIIGFLKLNKQETNADAFVPLLILVILKAKTANLISDMHYIEHYRAEEWLLHGETSYYLSSIQGAIGFIQNLSKEDLTIEKEEYDAHMEAWDAEQKQLEREREEIAQVVAAARAAEEEEAASSSVRDGNGGLAVAGAGYPVESVQPVTISQPNPTYSDQMSLSPSSVLLSSAGMVGKSIVNFLSPSPQPEPETISSQPQTNQRNSDQPSSNNETSQATKEAFESLCQMFPNLDKGILQDLVYIKNGNIDECVDTCLELVSDT